VIEQTVKKYSNGKSAEDKKMISDTILPFLRDIENEIIKEHYMRLLASGLDTSFESIQRQIEKGKNQQTVETVVKAAKEKKGREEILEEYLLSLLLQSPLPKQAIEQTITILSTYMPKERAYQKILAHLLVHFQQQEGIDIHRFGNGLSEELVKTYDTCFLYPIPKFVDDTAYLLEVKKVATQLKTQYIRSRLKVLSEKMKTSENESEIDNPELVRWQEEFNTLSAQLS
jgi:DNA primase